MSNIANIAAAHDVAEFVVARTSKAGKVTERGALGVILSGNAAERQELATAVIEAMASSHNYKALLKECLRAFPVSTLKKSKGVAMFGGAVSFLETATLDGATVTVVTELDIAKANKAMAIAFGRALQTVVDAAALNGEKKALYEALQGVIRRDEEYRASLASPAIEAA